MPSGPLAACQCPDALRVDFKASSSPLEGGFQDADTSLKKSSAIHVVAMHGPFMHAPPNNGSVIKIGSEIECTSPLSPWRSNGDCISVPPTFNLTDDPSRLYRT